MSPCTAKGLLGYLFIVFGRAGSLQGHGLSAGSSPGAVHGLLRQRPPLWDTGSKECWPPWWRRVASVPVVPALSSKASIVLVPRALSLAAPQQVGPSQAESRSPALASRPFATEPPGKPRISLF